MVANKFYNVVINLNNGKGMVLLSATIRDLLVEAGNVKAADVASIEFYPV